MNSLIKSKFIVKPTMYQNTKSMYQPPSISAEDLEDLKNKIFGTQTDFVRPSPKYGSMLNKKTIELEDILSSMAVEQSGNVKLYKTANNYMNKLEKPEQPSLVFIDDVFAFSGYPYSIEILPDSLETLDFDIVSKCRFFEANEGTVLRVFNANGEWYTITNKKLDAFTCKWSSKTKTFGCHLAKSIFSLLNPDHIGDKPFFDDVSVSKEYVNQIWSSSLDPSTRYFFLLKSSNEERVVCDADEAILNIGVIDENNQLTLDKLVKLTDLSQYATVQIPIEHKFSSLVDLIEKVRNIDHTKCSGLLAIFKTDFSGANIEANIEQHIHVKLLNPRYKYLHSLRGNVTSLRFRLFQLIYLTNRELQLVSPIEPSYVEDFKKLYPECKKIDEIVWVLVQEIFKIYQSLHVKHEICEQPLPQKMGNIIRFIHHEYLATKQPTTIQKIADMISYIQPEQLNQLIREYENRIKKQEYENKNNLTQ